MKADRKVSRCLCGTVAAVLIILILFGGFTYYIDPVCHYHKPLEKYDYTGVYAYYLNDGIIRNYDFTAVITGTSMTDNFKTSEAEALFGGSFVKLPLSGTSFKEISNQISRIYARGKSPSLIIRALDEDMIYMDKDSSTRDFSEFEYMYNDRLLDDVKYLINLEMFFRYTRELMGKKNESGNPPIDFDRYCSWEFDTGKAAVTASYTLPETAETERVFTEADRQLVVENIAQNVTAVAYEHPETDFICYIAPYSVGFWDMMNAGKKIHWQIEAEKTAVEEILRCPNIRLYAFSDNFELVSDLDNYSDDHHYDGNVSSRLLGWMSEDKYRLSEENYEEYFEKIEQYFSEFDYAQLHE